MRRDFADTKPSLLIELRHWADAPGTLSPSGKPSGRDSSEHAWRRFFDLYAPPVYAVAIRRGLRASDAEDVVQQVMLAVLGHIAEFRYETSRGKFRHWVLRITESKIVDVFRRRRAGERDGGARSLGDVGDDEQPGAAWEEQWRMQDLLYCLDQVAADISPRRMEAFRLYVLQGMSAAATAQHLGMTVGHVYVTRNQVLRMIRERMLTLEERRGDNEDGGGHGTERGDESAAQDDEP